MIAPATIITSGDCGDQGKNVRWTLYSDEKLVIGGEGAMEDWLLDSEFAFVPPWWEYRESIVSVEIESGVTRIGDCAFEPCDSLTSIEIPNSVTSIGSHAFFDCGSLTSVKIPNGVTEIVDWVFAYCGSLMCVEIPDGVSSIGYSAFEGCSSLTSAEIPNSVTRIDDWAFSDCSSLTSITIPNSVTSIGDGAFYGCSSLIVGVYSGSYAERYCIDNDLKYNVIGIDPSGPVFKLPAGMNAIKEEAFANRNIEQVIIPNGCKSIGVRAFAECVSLKVVEIPDSVTDIVDDAFAGSSNVVIVTAENSKAAKYAESKEIRYLIQNGTLVSAE